MINTDLFQYQKTLLPQLCLGNAIKLQTLVLCHWHLSEAKFAGRTNIFYYTNRKSQRREISFLARSPSSCLKLKQFWFKNTDTQLYLDAKWGWAVQKQHWFHQSIAWGDQTHPGCQDCPTRISSLIPKSTGSVWPLHFAEVITGVRLSTSDLW